MKIFTHDYSRMARCDCGNCTVKCPGACYCIADSKHPDQFMCDCIPPIFKKRSNKKGGKKIPVNKSKRRLKVTPQARFNICIHNAPITSLAQSFDKSLPNRILIPANKLTKKVTLRLKNKTFRQIIISSGLTVKG